MAEHILSYTLQIIIGETDQEILKTTKLYRDLQLARVYYSAFHPIIDTPLENHAPTDPLRELRLYQTDFLFRQYGFTLEELTFDANGLLPLDTAPKTAYALAHPEKFPLEINHAWRDAARTQAGHAQRHAHPRTAPYSQIE